MSDLEPITRNEMLWSGEDLEPKTRREKYIRHLYDETQVIPDSPKTREEMFILKAGEELHDVTIEQLTATENGTYSEEGVAYSPVIVNVPAPVLDELTVTENGTYTPGSGTDGYNEVNVNVQPTLAMKNITANGTYTASDDNADGYSSVSVNVPLPENAYLLKEIEDVEIASFNDGSDLPMAKLEVAIEPVQDLHGYDAPWVGGAGKNKFNKDGTDTSKGYISDGYLKSDGTIASSNEWSVSEYISISGNSVTVSGKTGYIPAVCFYDLNKNYISGESYENTNPENPKTFSIPTGAIYMRASILNSGLNVIQVELGFTATSYEPYSNICPISGWSEVNVTVADDTTDPTTENVYTIDLDGTRYGGKLDVANGIVTPAPYYASYNGEALTGEWISDRDKYEVGTTPTIGAQVVNIGASDTPVSITPTIIKSLQGDNNFFASTGKVIKLQYWAKEVI